MLMRLSSLLLILVSVNAFAGKAAIFSGLDVKILKPNLDLNGAAKILTGTDDPTLVATDAPTSSQYLNTLTGIGYTKMDAGLTTNWVMNLTTGLYGTTTIPNGSTTSTTPVTSASTTFVDVMTTTVVVTQTTIIHAVAIANLKATTAVAVAGFRVQINGVNGQTMLVNLADITNQYPVMAQQFSASLTPGTYTVKAQMQRSSGAGTVNFTNGTLFAQAQQAIANTNSPSRILYVAKNGGGTGADGSWSKPYSTISAAVATAVLTSSFNNPIGIAVAPGVGSVQYSDTSPVTISVGGISIFAMTSPGYKGVQVHYSGSLNVAMTGSSLNFGLFGIEINCPSTANWNATPAALYSTGTASSNIFVDAVVLNSNGTARHALYNDNPSGTVWVTNSDIKSGSAAGPNRPAVKNVAGTMNLSANHIAERQTGTAGISIDSAGGTINLTDGDVLGRIYKSSNSSIINIFNESNITSGVNAPISTGVTAGSGAVNLFSAVLTSSAAYAVTGGEVLRLGQAIYGGTAVSLDPALTLIGYVIQSGHNKMMSLLVGNTPVTATNVAVVVNNGHIQSTQTVAPIATVNANAGVGATCTLSNATDVAGQVNITTGASAVATGSYCSVAFNKTYNVAPICVLTPAGNTLSSSVYVGSSTTAMTINFAVAGGNSTSYLENFHCMETQ